MQTLLLSTVAVAIAEIGDKTQLLSLILAARYRRPLPICLGILLATLLNHALAGSVGAYLGDWLSPELLKWTVAVSFLAIGLWTLVPDKMGDDKVDPSARNVLVAPRSLSSRRDGRQDPGRHGRLALSIRRCGQSLRVPRSHVAGQRPVVWFGARFATGCRCRGRMAQP